jgi:hypothetical protein
MSATREPSSVLKKQWPYMMPALPAENLGKSSSSPCPELDSVRAAKLRVLGRQSRPVPLERADAGIDGGDVAHRHAVGELSDAIRLEVGIVEERGDVVCHGHTGCASTSSRFRRSHSRRRAVHVRESARV